MMSDKVGKVDKVKLVYSAAKKCLIAEGFEKEAEDHHLVMAFLRNIKETESLNLFDKSSFSKEAGVQDWWGQMKNYMMKPETIDWMKKYGPQLGGAAVGALGGGLLGGMSGNRGNRMPGALGGALMGGLSGGLMGHGFSPQINKQLGGAYRGMFG